MSLLDLIDFLIQEKEFFAQTNFFYAVAKKPSSQNQAAWKEIVVEYRNRTGRDDNLFGRTIGNMTLLYICDDPTPLKAPHPTQVKLWY